SEDQLSRIDKEIEDAECLITDPNTLFTAHEAGLVDAVTVSSLIGFDAEKVVPLAIEERAERIRLAMEAQGGMENASAARGAKEFGGLDGSTEKIGKGRRGEED